MSKATPDIIRQIYALLGRVVLLPVPLKSKAPKDEGWNKLTYDDTQTDAYQKRLVGGNVGVALGPISDGLTAIDVDDDDVFAEFMRLNPMFRDTFVSRGKRGAQIWFRLADRPDLRARGFVTEWPRLNPLKWPAEKPPAGKAPEEMPQPRKFGEWRGGGTGCQSIVWGVHKDPPHVSYRWAQAKPAKEVVFRDIRWPAGLPLPWLEQLHTNLVELWGEPWLEGEDQNGEVTYSIQEPYWAGRFRLDHEVLFEPGEGRYYIYSGEVRGLWRRAEEGEVLNMIGSDMLRFSRVDPRFAFVSQPKFRSAKIINSVMQWLKGQAVRRDAFPFKEGIVHLENGMLDLEGEKPELKPFASEFYSRNQIPVSYVPGATCPRFETELLASALPADDIDLLQRWAGMWLLGVNVRQKFLLLTGTAGGGKSTVVKVLSRMIGLENIAQLRTEQLAERFELANYVGKTGLVGSDVPGDFLMRDGAYMIKSLTGGDIMTTESKGVNDRATIEGKFNIIITSNSKLKLKLDTDSDAWRRRLLIINYDRPKTKEAIDRFDELLVKTEGSGILNWMIAGALKVLAGDKLKPNDRQQSIVDGLLEESDSVRSFIKRCVAERKGKDVTGEEMAEAYGTCCEKFGWNPIPISKFEKIVPDLILQLFSKPKINSITRENKAKRGWKGLAIEIPDFGEATDAPSPPSTPEEPEWHGPSAAEQAALGIEEEPERFED